MSICKEKCCKVWLLGNTKYLVLGHTILYKGNQPDCVMREAQSMIHTIENTGYIKFYVKFIYLLLKHGIDNDIMKSIRNKTL